MRSRVASNNSSAIAHLKSGFGFDLSQWGELSPDQVRQMAIAAKTSKIQKELAAAASKYFEEFLANQKEIERLTQEAINCGLKTDTEIRGYINKAAIASAKHDAKIQQLEHQLKQELQFVKAESLSEKALSTASFQQRLLLLRQSHQSRLQVGNASFQQQLKQAQQMPAIAAAEARDRQNFQAYINAKDFNPYPSSPATGGASRGGIFGGLIGFLLGRK